MQLIRRQKRDMAKYSKKTRVSVKKTARKTPGVTAKKKRRPDTKPAASKKTPVSGRRKASPLKRVKRTFRQKLFTSSQTIFAPVTDNLAGQQAGRQDFFQEPVGELPAGYGDHSIYLLIRDPYWIYAYWEIQRDKQEDALRRLGGDWAKVQSILRVYVLNGDSSGSGFFDVTLGNDADSWYIEVQPNGSYVVEIGLLHEDGRFIALARSNTVTTPRAGMSEVLDEQWMGIDFDKMYALSGGFEVGRSSADLKKRLEERMWNALSSGSGSGLMASSAGKRGFWFTLDCELIVYGATEPGASVTLQGKPVKLRPDGTFTVRFSLPDGRLVLNAEAVSPDRLEKRTLTPAVERHTEHPSSQVRTQGKF